jgi:D-sedoheptulose 7-phosphate isomerase
VTFDAESLARAVTRKSEESARVQRAFFDAHAAELARCAVDLAARFDAGGRLFAFGNGGSACDAQHLALELVHPVVEKRPALPAFALGADATLLSAIANDGDFAQAFADPLRLHGRAGDVAVGISTSGDAASTCRALEAARELGMVTVGLAGRDGGRMARLCDHLFVVPSYSIHRIQEAHGIAIHVLWDLVMMARGAEDVL